MSVILYFRDGTNAVLSDGVVLQPYPNNDNWLQVLDAANQPYAIASVKSLHYAQYGA